MKKLLYWLPSVGWMALIWILSSQPGQPDREGWFPHFDKLLHFGAFFVLAALLLFALRTSTRLDWKGAGGIALVIASAYGGIDEWHQLSVPDRSSELLDWIADTAGALACVFILPRIPLLTPEP